MKKIILTLSILALSALGASAAEASTVTRSFDNPAPVPGSTLNVSLTIVADPADIGGVILIDEIFPASWTVTDPGTASVLGAGTVANGHIRWLELSGAVSTVINYTLTVPASAVGVMAFSGEFAFDSNGVTPVPIAGATSVNVPTALAVINVTPNPVTIAGLTQQFTAAALDQLGNPFAATIAWSGNNPAVGTINPATGLFTVVGAGTVTITASSGLISGTAAATVAATLTTINVTPATIAIDATQNTTFTAATLDQFGQPMMAVATWTSSDPLIATINSGTGVLTGVSGGTVTVTATSGAIAGTATATIRPLVLTTINITPASASLIVSQTRQFSAATLDQLGGAIAGTVVWISSDPLVGTINATGLFTAVGEGTSVITASVGAVSGTASVTVGPLAATTINVTPLTATITGGTQQFSAAVLDQVGNPFAATVAWFSSDSLVGTIDASGLFTALKAGTATITASSGTASGSATITVQAVLTTVNIAAAHSLVAMGIPEIFTAQTLDQFNNAMAATLTWTSSDPLVGTIDAATGLFTPVAVGSALVTAASGAVSHALTVAVVNDAPATITILGDNPATVNLAAIYTDAGATALDDLDPVATVVTTGLPLDTTTVGVRSVTYTVTDSVGNVSTLSRTVNVILPAGTDSAIVLTAVNEWTIFSAPQRVSAIQITAADFQSLLAFDAAIQQFVQITDPADAQLLNPLNAFYIRPNKVTMIGFTNAAPADPALLLTKNLSDNWNLVSSTNAGLVQNELSSIQTTINHSGMVTLFVPQTFNSRKGVFADFGVNANIDLNANPITQLPAAALSPFDGYWVSMNGADIFSKIAQ